MTDEILDGTVYPSGEMDLKRRIAGEIFRLYENLEKRLPDGDLVDLIERAFVHIRTKHMHKIQAGRPIEVAAEVRKFLSEAKKGT